MKNSRTARHRIDEAAVESQDRALAVVQRLLKERGISARCHHTIRIGLFVDEVDESAPLGEPSLQSWLERYPPELIVIGPQGWWEATVTMGPRSGYYLVSLRRGPQLQKVGRERPEKVVDLIAKARPAPAT